MNTTPDFLTIPDLQRRWGISLSTICYLISQFYLDDVYVYAPVTQKYIDLKGLSFQSAIENPSYCIEIPTGKEDKDQMLTVLYKPEHKEKIMVNLSKMLIKYESIIYFEKSGVLPKICKTLDDYENLKTPYTLVINSKKITIDFAHPLLPNELSIAIKTAEKLCKIINQQEEFDEEGRTINHRKKNKQIILDLLKTYQLTNEAKERLAKVINPKPTAKGRVNELAIAIEVWIHLFGNKDKSFHPKRGFKNLILNFLNNNKDKYGDILSNSAIDRIATVIHPNPTGGTPRI